MAYPTSIISFSTHNTGDIIQASDPNNIQTEVVSVETDLINGLRVNVIPLTDVAKNVGATGTRWQNIYSSALYALDVASRVNYVELDASATGNAVNMKSTGSDSTVNFTIGTKGGTQLKLVDVASLVNFFQVSGKATGNAPDFAFTGSDSTVGGTISTKGGIQIKFTDVASIVNYFQLAAKATGTDPTLTITGDANRGLQIIPAGTGSFAVSGLFATDGANAGRLNTGGAVAGVNRTRMLQTMAGVHQNAATSVTANTATAMALQVADFNTDTMWASGSNTRLTAQIAGKYLVAGQVTFATYTPTDIQQVWFRKNGTTDVTPRDTRYFAIGRAWSGAIAYVVSLAATDYVELMAIQNSGGAVNSSGDLNTGACMVYLGE